MHRLHMLKRRRASYAKVETAGERPSPLAKLMPPGMRRATMGEREGARATDAGEGACAKCAPAGGE